jgi:hypothetical protein
MQPAALQLGPREDVFEFKDAGWWTVPAAEASMADFPTRAPPSGEGPPLAKPEMSGAALGFLARLAEPRRRIHQKVQVGLALFHRFILQQLMTPPVWSMYNQSARGSGNPRCRSLRWG